MKQVFLTCKEQCHSLFSYHTHKVIGLIVWNGSTRLIGSKERKYPRKNAQERLTWKQSFFQAVPCEVKMKEDEKRRIQDESNPRAEATETKPSLLKAICFCNRGCSYPLPLPHGHLDVLLHFYFSSCGIFCWPLVPCE